MSETTIQKLMSEAVQPGSIRIVGNYTNPRTYGVYRLHSSSVGRDVRFGNHPVRETELNREFGKTEIIAVFLQREHAKELADLLNQG